MKGNDRLEFFRGYWPTDKGAWYPGEKVLYREKSLFDDFNNKSWMTLLLYGLSGKMPSPVEAKVVELFWSLSTSFPDPRLWNNRVAALGGSSRSTAVLSISAATAISEAKVFGAKPLYLGAKFLHQLAALESDPEAFEDAIISRLKRDRYLPGFGRPIISDDERIVPFVEQMRKTGFEKGPFQVLLDRICEVLKKNRYRLKPNIAIYGAAVFADMGFDPYQSYLIVVLTFSAGFFPCYLDGREKPEGVIFPLTCDSIEYSGKGKRQLK